MSRTTGFTFDPFHRWIAEVQVDLDRHLMWLKYRDRLEALGVIDGGQIHTWPRQQTLLQHCMSCAFLAQGIIARVRNTTLIEHDAELIVTAALVHKVGEAKLRNGPNDISLPERAWRDQKPADRVAEYEAFRPSISELPKDVAARVEAAFLLQLARYPAEQFPEELRQKVQALRESRAQAVRLFQYIETANYLIYAREMQEYLRDDHLLTWVLRNIVPELNRLADDSLVIRDLLWTSSERAWANRWLDDHKRLPDEDGATLDIRPQPAA